ncbi:MAG: hypothetical protein KA327_11235 [Pseudarcicella sp.]|nr:hypothetical protein [Pseudarcicella sp.]
MKNIKNIIYLLSLAISLYGCDKSNDLTSSPNNNNGIAGSTARFALGENHLYTLNSKSMNVYDLTKPDKPNFVSNVFLGDGIETIFPYKDMLFFGTNTGMLIYDNKTPSKPTFISTFVHAYACDPVVVQGQYAYVTIRSGTECRGGRENRLDVIDISSPQHPKQVSSILMSNPHGLGVDGNRLFVCEGEYGLKVFDISIPTKPVQIEELPNAQSYDVIPNKNILVVTGKYGISQYDYSLSQKLVLLSKIQIHEK